MTATPFHRSLLAAAIALAGNAACAADFPDPVTSMPVSKENIAGGLEADAYANAINAFVWGYPLVRMERVAREYTDVPKPKPATSYRAPLNQIGWATELATPAARDMPTANNDTLYMSAVVKLDEPYVLHVPDTKDRYYVVNVFNMWQELEHYVGRRATGTKAGDFVLAPPGWKGELPAGLKRLDVTTGKIWLWGRLRVIQGEGLDTVHALQKQFTLRPLSQWKNAGYQPKSTALPALPAIAGDDLGFYKHLGFVLADNAIPARDESLFAQFARIGLTGKGFDPAKLAPPQKQGLERGIGDAPKVPVSAFASTTVNWNGWTTALNLDHFGSDYPTRALVAGPYLGGQGAAEAIYLLRTTDADGKPLSGAKRYVARFKKAPPVDAFWSLTLYNADDKMLVENPIQRYKLGDDTQGLKIGANGGFDVPLQTAKPGGEFAANWLPAPKGGYYLLLRMYQPRPEVAAGKYPMPEIVEVK